MKTVFACVVLVIYLLSVTEAIYTPEDEEFMKTLPADWKADLPACPGNSHPYIIYYGHRDPVDMKLIPNMNGQDAYQSLVKSEKDFPDQPYAKLKHDRSTEDCDHLEVKAKPGKSFIVSRICFKTFAVNTVDTILYSTVNGKEKPFEHFEVDPPVGPEFFRHVCVHGSNNKLVDEIHFKYTVQAVSFYMRALTMFTCLPNEGEPPKKGRKGKKPKKPRKPRRNRNKRKQDQDEAA